MANVRPLGDRVVVKPQEGKILAVGSGKLLDSGERVPMELQIGDAVLYAKYAGTEFKLDDENVLILSERDILAVVEGREG
jgi:chaperonin GroES